MMPRVCLFVLVSVFFTRNVHLTYFIATYKRLDALWQKMPIE